MNPYLDDGDVQLYLGEARAVLAELPERSVHAIATSPPFYGLRDYGTGTWEGGDPACPHERPATTMNVGFNERWGQGGGERRQERSGGQWAGSCPDCGAVRVDHQIGLEATPDEWVESLVEVFRACRRVLRDDGSLWIEVGESYVGTAPAYEFPFLRTDAAWLAALIDGEGSVQIHRQRARPGTMADSFQVDVSVAMKDKAVVEHAHRITGIGSLSEQQKGEYGTQWDWGVRGQQAARLLRAIYPWLILKRGQAALAVMCAEDLAARKFGRGNPATVEALEYREALRQSVMALNQRREPAIEPREPPRLTVDPGLGLKPKDVCGAPWLLAAALRADGWYLRGVYPWLKPDAMPESVRDRCTVDYSYLFQFSKSARYFFDRDAIREPFSDYSTGGDGGSYGANADATRPPTGGPRSSRTYLRNRGGVPDGQVELDGAEPEQEVVGPDGRTAFHLEAKHNSEQHRDGTRWPSLEGRSPRSVWRITTEANSFGLCPACRRYWPEKAPADHCGVAVVAHFAVWPHRLVERIVACSTSDAGVCADCGAPRVRQTSEELVVDHLTTTTRTVKKDGGDDGDHGSWGIGERVIGSYEVTTLGWEPTCECAAATVPATVLDPFGGSGTTARQARRMGRRCVLVELSPDYAEIAAHRLSQLALPLVAAEA